MRKIMSLMLTVVLLFSCCAFGFAETNDSDDNAVMFDAGITKAIEQTAANWFASKDMRAMATILLALDYSVAIDEDSPLFPDLSESTYIGKDGLDLVVYMHAGEKDIIIVYRPVSGEAVYTEMDASSDVVIEAAMSAICSDGYYENDIETMYSIAQQINDVLNSDG